MRTLYYTLDAEGMPVPCPDAIEWAKWFEGRERRVERTVIEDGGDSDIMVSTVFLGMDHSFTGGEPVLWETMIFAEGRSFDQQTRRYTSLAAARKGHDAAVGFVYHALGLSLPDTYAALEAIKEGRVK